MYFLLQFKIFMVNSDLRIIAKIMISFLGIKKIIDVSFCIVTSATTVPIQS